MESQAKTGTDGMLMVVEEPETLVLPEEVALPISTEENQHFASAPPSMLNECGRLSAAWQEGEGSNPCRPSLGLGGEDFHLTVMLEGGYTSSSDQSRVVVAMEEVTRENLGVGGGGAVGDRSGDVTTITSSDLERGQYLSEVGQTISVTTREKTTNPSHNLSSGIILAPSFLAGSGRKVYVPPPDPGNLEYVGVDSQSVGFWYDGGRNLYSCPALPDNPQRVPSISELSLVCKSMLQWSNKLKQLRQSVIEADSKLAQTIKDYFMPRVKSATQRQPKDPNHVQRLVPLEHLKQLAEAVRSRASATATTASTEVKPSPLIPTPLVPAAIAGGGMLVVPASTCHSIPVLPMFNPHFMFPSTSPQCLDKSVTFPSAFTGASPNLKGTGVGGEGGEGMQTMTVEQGLALAQALFSTSGILQTDLGQPIILSVPPLLRMTVTDPVRVDTVDFTSKSIEISGETPIRTVDVDDGAVTSQKATFLLAAESKADPSASKSCREAAPSQLSVNSLPGDTMVTASTTPSTAPAAGVDHCPTTVVAATVEDAALSELATLSQTHTSTEVMSAKMLLSLTGKEWCTSPVTSDHSSFRGHTHTATLTTATTVQSGLSSSAPGLSVSSDSGTSTVQHSKRTQRKQKPIASARQVDLTTPAKPPGRVRSKARRKGAVGACGEEEATIPPGGTGAVSSSGAKRVRRPGAARKRVVKGVQHQEGLAAPHDLSTTMGAPCAEGAMVSNSTHHLNDDSNRASDQLLELKAQQSEIPVKEYVIDTDSDSETSSSGSTSDTGSSTEESSSTTSEGSRVGAEEEVFLGGDPFLSGQGIIRGQKGGVVDGRRGHVVKIPRHLLPEKLKNKSSRFAESEVDRLTQDIMADHPLDLATLYAHQGALDLSTLSEITQQPSQSDSVEAMVDTGSRSKRTCVRVREQIHRLREILEGDSINQVSSPRSRGRSQKRGGEGEGGGSAAKRSRKSGYRNQFTHKRRKKRKKLSEDEPLWQSARKNPSGGTLTRVFVFSTDLANKAAESVDRGEYDSIIQFHQAQPKGPGFFRPANESQLDPTDRSPGKGNLSYEAPKTKQSCSPNSVTLMNSAASSPGGVGMGEEECNPHISPASLPSRTQSRQSRRLKKQSSWAGSTAHSPPVTPGEMLGSVGRTRKASPLPYKSPTENHEVAFQWGNPKDPDEEHNADIEERLRALEGQGREDWSGHLDRKGNVKEHYSTNAMAKPSSQKNQLELVVTAPRQQHAVNHISEVDGQGNMTSPAMTSSPANPSTAGSREDANYTICHGNPGSGMQRDISSPILTTRGIQQPSSVHSTSEASFSPHPPHPTSLPRGVQPQMEMSEHYGGNGQQVAWNPSNQYPSPGSGGGGGGYHPHHPQLSGLSYSAHPMSAMQVHSGYPYPLSYPWGHMSPIHQHQLRAEEMMHAQQMGAHIGYMHHPPPPPPPSMMEEDSGSSAKDVPTSIFLPNPSPVPHPPPLTSNALSPVMSQASHPPQTAHQHHLQPGVPLQRHYQALPPDYFGHPSAHIFPYGFEGAGLQQMHHLWPQSHVGGGGPLPPAPASVIHPGHMIPGGHGGWYPPHLVHSMVSGVEVHGGVGDGGKAAGKKGSKHEGMQAVDVKLNTNGNNNVTLNTNGNNSGDKRMELRRLSLECPVAGRLCGDDCSPTVSVNSGALLVPLQPRWPCLKEGAPISVELQKSEPFSVKVNWCK